MTNAIIAIALFIGILGAIAVFYIRMGNLSFWKLAAKLPDHAFEWFTNDPAWVILDRSQPTPGKEFVGPFLLAVPQIGQTIKLYAREDQIAQSQLRFIERYRGLLPFRNFPFLSALALLYPVVAMLSMASTPAAPVLILGYGFANIGYLLGVAFIVPGHFRILGLDDRIPTLVAAVVFWVIGVVLSNVAA